MSTIFAGLVCRTLEDAADLHISFVDATISFNGDGPFPINENGVFSVPMVLLADELDVDIEVELTGMSNTASEFSLIFSDPYLISSTVP